MEIHCKHIGSTDNNAVSVFTFPLNFQNKTKKIDRCSIFLSNQLSVEFYLIHIYTISAYFKSIIKLTKNDKQKYRHVCRRKH